jgi:hypothetical protein
MTRSIYFSLPTKNIATCKNSSELVFQTQKELFILIGDTDETKF